MTSYLNIYSYYESYQITSDYFCFNNIFIEMIEESNLNPVCNQLDLNYNNQIMNKLKEQFDVIIGNL